MKMELGAQTFTVRDYMQTTWDFREAMKRIAEIGYTWRAAVGGGQCAGSGAAGHLR